MRLIHGLVVSVVAGLASCHPTARQASGKPVFAHYMVGGITDEHTRQDIQDAKGVGLDAFALNFDQFASWSESTVESLFKHADELGFGLFFSFDHAAGHLSAPSDYADYLKQYMTRSSYYKYNNKPLVSTFGGEGISDSQWKSFKDSVGDIILIPGFYQATPSESFFNDRGSLDGVFNWNAWSFPTSGKEIVPTKDDKTFQTAAKNAQKLFMMGISPIQFKHFKQGDSVQNWYRRGEDNLEYRFGQALEMQPDMLELQTWNDAGESHYMGNIWNEPLGDSPILKYVEGYDHKGYLQVLPAFIEAWKRNDKTTQNMVPTNGKDVQGVFWHHTLLTSADCSADPLGKPQDIANAEDVVSGIVLVAKGKTNLKAFVKVGDKQLGEPVDLVEGYNKFKRDGLTKGKVQVEIREDSTVIGSGSGSIEVTDSASLCNYNFQVVGFPG